MGKQILLVDSDQQFAKLVASVLEGRGHKIVQADSLKAAEAALNKPETPFDLMIVGSPMPQGDELHWILERRRSGMRQALPP